MQVKNKYSNRQIKLWTVFCILSYYIDLVALMVDDASVMQVFHTHEFTQQKETKFLQSS